MRFKQPPVIDGRLDEEVWAAGTLLKDFYQIQPGDNIAPSKPTEVRLGYDDKFLYIGFHAFDDAGGIRATVAKRDAIFDDDHVGIYLDTFNDQRKAFAFFFNPHGVQADAIFTEGGTEDFSVDILMESSGTLRKDGYIVEVAIPFKSLRYQAGKGKLWGIHFQRTIKRFNNELNSWMPISRDKSSFLAQAGHITGLEDISRARTLELIPSLTVSETGRRVATVRPSVLAANPSLIEPGRFVNQPIGLDPGLNLKYGITPTVTLDLALNPDFAQVEADETVVTANQRFPIFFEEKRPFFLEGIDIFQTPLPAVHTRAIVDPDYAAKLTGKLGRNTFGILFASDKSPGNYSEDERTTIRENYARFLSDQADPGINPETRFPFDNRIRLLDQKASIGIFRLKRDVGKENSLGFIATTYNFVERHNNLAGFDGRFRLDPQTVFSFQTLGTTSRRFFFDPDEGRNIYRTGNAFAYSWSYDKAMRHLNYTLSGSGNTRDYRADVGFTQRRNTNREDLTVRYNSEPNPNARLISWRLFTNLGTNFDWQGRMQNWGNASQLRANFRRETTINVGYSVGYERIFEEEFGAKRKPNRAGAFAGTDSERSTYRKSLIAYGSSVPSKRFSTSFNVSYLWDVFDFDFGAEPKFQRVSPGALRNPDAPLDPGPGNELRVELDFAYQPTNVLRFDLFYTKDRLVRHDTNLVAFDENIYALRSTYQFSRFTFARARVDINSLDSNIRGQFLLGWTPNPGTAFFVGYNDDLNRNGYSPFTGELEPGFRRNGRTFFIKLSYLFQRSF
jgi:hypothetical protein